MSSSSLSLSSSLSFPAEQEEAAAPNGLAARHCLDSLLSMEEHSANVFYDETMTGPPPPPPPPPSWFTLADLQSLAKSLRETLPPAIDGLAHVLQRSAIHVVTELKNGLEPEELQVAGEFEEDDDEVEEVEEEEEEEEEHDYAGEVGGEEKQGGGADDNDNEANEKHRHHDDDQDAGKENYLLADALPLPWEVLPSGAILCQEEAQLRDKIRQLSRCEETFTTPYSCHDEGVTAADFSMTHAQWIQRLLETDEDLVSMHRKLLTGACEVKEHYFWKNYFHHCDVLRRQFLAGTGPDWMSRSASSTLTPFSSPAVVSSSCCSLSTKSSVSTSSSSSSSTRLPPPPPANHHCGDDFVLVNHELGDDDKKKKKKNDDDVDEDDEDYDRISPQDIADFMSVTQKTTTAMSCSSSSGPSPLSIGVLE